MRPHRRSRVWGAVVEVLLAVLACSAAQAHGEEKAAERAGLSPAARFAILRARDALADPACRQIFAEFQDTSGRALQDRLDALGWSAQQYLDSMLFDDSGNHAGCNDPRTLAMTTPGNRIVLLCGSKFSSLIRREPATLWVTILHEELHSVGLGENPPTPAEISRVVAQRCR